MSKDKGPLPVKSKEHEQWIPSDANPVRQHAQMAGDLGPGAASESGKGPNLPNTAYKK